MLICGFVSCDAKPLNASLSVVGTVRATPFATGGLCAPFLPWKPVCFDFEEYSSEKERTFNSVQVSYSVLPIKHAATSIV